MPATITKIHASTQPQARPTLVVDLDGTLTATDTLVESLLKLVKQAPMTLLKLPLWLLQGRTVLKNKVAERARLCAEVLPYRAALLSYLAEQKREGRRIVLATAAHETIANSVSRHLDLFDAVLATNATDNLKGKAKLAAIRERIGEPFVYAGDSRADLPIWDAAHAAILVDVAPGLADSVRGKTTIEREFDGHSASLKDWVRALRVHQWLKNLLLFVPLLTAFSFLEPGNLQKALIAFLAFSLTASATYIVNDLWDLENDRQHPRKRHRPFASGKLSILHGLAVAAVCLGISFALAACVSLGFSLMLALYLALTSAYSWALKRLVLIDVLMLSILYTLRILAGTVAIGVETSYWLLAFSIFIFLSLAIVKRCAELVSLKELNTEATHGRDYRVGDLVILWPLGVCTAMSAVVVFGLFISAPETLQRYASPQLLWLDALCLIYWLSVVWIRTARGEMHDDPIVFAAKDRASLATVTAMVLITLTAHFISLANLLQS